MKISSLINVFRCGSRTPANPRWTWDSVCNCTGPGAGIGKGFLIRSQIKDMDATYRWETYNKLDRFGVTFNTLTDPRSKDFIALKQNIEARVTDCDSIIDNLYNCII